MTKSKIFWAGLAAISAITAGFSGYSVYNRLTVHFTDDTVNLTPKPAPFPEGVADGKPRTEPSVPPLPDIDKTNEKPPALEEAKAVKEMSEEPRKQKAIKTVFNYKSASAKGVSLAGSFTRWKEVKMAKKNGVWSTEVYILPGNYLYHFTVDGKKTLDPVKAKTPVGESVAVVEEQGKN
jgi:hypothetical protein